MTVDPELARERLIEAVRDVVAQYREDDAIADAEQAPLEGALFDDLAALAEALSDFDTATRGVKKGGAG